MLSIGDLNLSNQEPLIRAVRTTCPVCHRQRSHYCYDCLIPLTNDVPHLKLPVQVDIAQHGETNAKATSTHAALVASDDVRIFRHSSSTSHHRRQQYLSLELPDYDLETTVVLFPEGKETDVVGQCRPFQRVVLLEGSWRKARTLLSHPKLQPLRRVQLPLSLRSTFWRHGDGTFRGALEEGVCTIEAIYYMCQLLQPHTCWDNLLWYYTFQLQLVGGRAHLRQQLAAGATPQVASREEEGHRCEGDQNDREQR
eukprot:jgi/Botrbrau1/21421/Bobra.0216s0036.1